MAYFRRAKGGWRAEVVCRGVRKSASFSTKAAASAWAAREEAAILDGAQGLYPSRTLKEALVRYVDEVSPRKRGERAERHRAEALIADFPALAAKVLHKITPDDLGQWRDARLRQVLPATVRRDINTFRNVWSVAAREWRWCQAESPWRSIKIPTDSAPRETLMHWREIRALCRRCNYLTGAVPLTGLQCVAWALLVALRTGMRSGEIMSLTAGTVDLDARVATLPQHKTLHVTGRARRVPLTQHGVRLLAPLVDSARAQGREGLWLIKPASLDTLFRKARDKLLLGHLHFHDSRATALTALARRVDVLTLARVSGHRDLNELLNTYYREQDTAIAHRLALLPRPQSRPSPTSGHGG